MIPVKAERAEYIETVSNDPVSDRQTGNNIPDTLILGEGQTLRTIALDLFGNKEFWVYIYQKNIHNIKNPNVITTGTEILIPDISEYDINANNPGSVAKAKEKGERIINAL